jgi:hypothetical protein
MGAFGDVVIVNGFVVPKHLKKQIKKECEYFDSRQYSDEKKYFIAPHSLYGLRYNDHLMEGRMYYGYIRAVPFGVIDSEMFDHIKDSFEDERFEGSSTKLIIPNFCDCCT